LNRFANILFAIALSCIAALPAAAQSPDSSLVIRETPDGQKLVRLKLASTTRWLDTLLLPDRFLVRNSAVVLLDSVKVNPLHYDFDNRYGKLIFRDKLFLTEGQHVLIITYKVLPFVFKDSYFRREIIVQKDTSGQGVQLVRKNEDKSLISVDDIFSGTDLRKSGSLVRGVTVGSNQDLTLTSGFRLQLDGNLTPDIAVTAALTDENVPIQPEGNTQTIQEFDKVFVEVRSRNVKVTLGDFETGNTETEFARFSRKLEGGKIEANYDFGGVKTEVQFAAAISRGKFNSVQFNGTDGVQGPYRLTGKNGESLIVVLAGTEKVFVNGELQTRGQTNDYVIEYASGEITFQPRRLITASTRITVDFEYSDQQYSRNFLDGKVKTSFLDDAVIFQASFFREADDPSSPLDYTLTARDSAILKAAGSDPKKALDTLQTYVGVDSLGHGLGQYGRVDS
jgi:hypothetical protein